MERWATHATLRLPTHTVKEWSLGAQKKTTATKQKVIAVYASGLLYTHTHIRGGRKHSGRSVQPFFLNQMNCKRRMLNKRWVEVQRRNNPFIFDNMDTPWGKYFDLWGLTGKPWDVSNSRRRLGHRKTLQMRPFTFKHRYGEVRTKVSVLKWEDPGFLNPLFRWHMAEGSH